MGVAAGFDKHAEAMKGLFGLGLGFVEVGSVTPAPQPGNAKPRMFRLVEDKGVINRYGFNSEGLAAAKRRLAGYWEARLVRGEDGASGEGVVGVNVGKNKLTAAAEEDYVKGGWCVFFCSVDGRASVRRTNPTQTPIPNTHTNTRPNRGAGAGNVCRLLTW